MLNIISMLSKPHISFNHLPAPEKEAVTCGESRKSSKFLRVAWNNSQKSNSGNCSAHKWWSIDNLECEAFCAAIRYLHHLWECSVCKAVKHRAKTGTWAENGAKPKDGSCGQIVPVSSKGRQCWAWSCWCEKGRLDWKHTKKGCWWPSVQWPISSQPAAAELSKIFKNLREGFARTTGLFLQPFDPFECLNTCENATV